MKTSFIFRYPSIYYRFVIIYATSCTSISLLATLVAFDGKEPIMPEKSEIARLRNQIEAEHRAAEFAMNGLAVGTARHWFIQRRMERMTMSVKKLESIVGEKEAKRIYSDTLDSIKPDRS